MPTGIVLTLRSVKGAPLTPTEVDDNFSDIKRFIEALEDEGGFTGRGIDSIDVTGDQLSVTLTDATVLGPFTLPKALFNPRGAWVSGTSYAVQDVVVGTTSATLGNGYAAIVANSDTDFDASLAANKWVKITSRGATGPTGAQGLTGAAGATGLPGMTGIAGITGIPGITGSQGPAGTNGAAGAAGPTGPAGVTGYGVTGVQGPAGPVNFFVDTLPPPTAIGLTGDVGLDGNGNVYRKDDGINWTQKVIIRGPTGVGITGLQGPTGIGITGAQGAQGPTGSGGGGAWEFVTSTTPTAVSEIDFTSLAASYDYLFVFEGVTPGINGAIPHVQLMQSGTPLTGSSDYESSVGGTDAQFYPQGSTAVGNASGRGMSCEFLLYEPNVGSRTKFLRMVGASVTSSGVLTLINSCGVLKANTNAVDGIRFKWSTGDWGTTGKINQYRRTVV